MTGIDEQIKLAERIVRGELKKSEVEKELQRISEEFGDDCFNSYKVIRKPKPWNKKDLDELEVLSASGASSKDFYLYMAEMSEAVYSETKKNNTKKIILLVIILAVAVVASIVFFMRFPFECGHVISSHDAELIDHP